MKLLMKKVQFLGFKIQLVHPIYVLVTLICYFSFYLLCLYLSETGDPAVYVIATFYCFPPYAFLSGIFCYVTMKQLRFEFGFLAAINVVAIVFVLCIQNPYHSDMWNYAFGFTFIYFLLQLGSFFLLYFIDRMISKYKKQEDESL